MIVLASKIDACQDPTRLEAVRVKAREHGSPFFAVSSVTGAGIEELRFAMSAALFDQEKNATISIGS